MSREIPTQSIEGGPTVPSEFWQHAFISPISAPPDFPRVEQVYGMCTACGAVEVALNRATGTRDLSDIGEAADYPTGYGCEVCS